MAGATKSSGAKKEVSELIRAVKKNGFDVIPGGGGHKKVVDRHGRVVTDKDGPLQISSSPSDVRWRVMHVSRFMKAGVLKEDPWNPEEKERGQGQNGSDPARVARIAAIVRETARRQERTNKIRSRMEPLVAKLGGWEKQGFQSDLGRVMFAFARSHNRVEAPKSEVAAVQSARQLKVGATMSDKAATCWELLTDELEKAWENEEIEGLRLRWTELVRMSRGLGTTPREPEPRAQLTLAPPLPGEVVSHPAADTRIPSLAMEVVARMAFGLSDAAELEKVLTLGERIAQLELREDQ